MKHYCFVALTLAVSLASPVIADSPSARYRDSWWWYVDSAASDGTNVYSYRMNIGVDPLATDGWDGESPIVIGDDPVGYALTWHEKNVDGWLGDTGFYRDDFRAPIQLGQTKTWLIYVWATPNVPDTCTTCGFHLANVVPGAPSQEYDTQFRLTLLSKPSSVIGGPDVGTVWDIDWPEAQVSLPIYCTDDGRTGYQFEFSATAVPEPGPLLALAAGLAPLILRRRR